MQNQVYIKLAKLLPSLLVSVSLIFDGFFILAFALIDLLIKIINADAPPSVRDNSKVIAWLAFAYFIVCIVSLVYWLLGKVVWRYIILVLGLVPFAVACDFLIMHGDFVNDSIFLRCLFYGLLITNSLLIGFIAFDIVKSKSIIQIQSE